MRDYFEFDEIKTIDLDGFTGDSGVIDRLDIRKTDKGFSVEIDPLYGVGGAVVAKKLALTCEPVAYDGKWPPK
ncbi:hypothetical protein [Vitreimonas flagellata]|uniref:hypothetical protein n=1 Tax=Vitreimonas flagellata TaxID=2560861 RepID=UPI001074CBB8|nr:hypothetical protein [Vitreimonas flagellata]